jgi:stearoyl-CoA desaturase (delta-9 desaturase)
LQYTLAILGAGALQRTIKWWVCHHRAHHRYVDTYRDPYNAKSGLLWSHIGWVLTRYDRKNWGAVDISDIENDPVVVWQHKNYLILAAISGGIFPVLVAHFGWNDWKGGLLYACIGRCILNWHLVWTINSLAHWVGDQPYSDRHTARQNLWIVLYSVGEGYHNYHHEFPSDYRNGPQWYDLDMSKWLIACWEKLTWASHLNRTSSVVIEKCMTHQVLKKSNPGWKGEPQNIRDLPLLKWDDYVEKTQQGQSLVAIAGVVHDVTEFMTKHPGGEKILRGAIGKDATAMFHGGVHNHSWNANNLLGEMQVAVVQGGGEVEGKR